MHHLDNRGVICIFVILMECNDLLIMCEGLCEGLRVGSWRVARLATVKQAGSHAEVMTYKS